MSEQAVRPYHHGNLRAELLERAERVVSERGVQELSLRELAREVGVSHAAPRRHFPDRRALLDALAEEGFDRLGREVAAAMDRAGPSFEARAAAFASAYVRFATRHAALLELMFAAKHGGVEGLHEAAERAFAAPRRLIAEGQAAGALEAGDPERVAMIMFATLQGLATMANGGMLEGAELDALVGDAVERLLRGLRPR